MSSNNNVIKAGIALILIIVIQALTITALATEYWIEGGGSKFVSILQCLNFKTFSEQGIPKGVCKNSQTVKENSQNIPAVIFSLIKWHGNFLNNLETTLKFAEKKINVLSDKTKCFLLRGHPGVPDTVSGPLNVPLH